MDNNFFNSIAKPLSFIGLVGLFFALLISIFGIQSTTCTMGDDDTLLLSLFFFTPITILFLVLSFLGSSKDSWLKWLTLPVLTIIPFALVFVAKLFVALTLDSNHLCAFLNQENAFNEYERAEISAYWAPAQFLVLFITLWCIFKYWRFNLMRINNE